METEKYLLGKMMNKTRSINKLTLTIIVQNQYLKKVKHYITFKDSGKWYLKL